MCQNGFEMIQKHLEIMFDNKVIIFDHFDDVTVKVDWSEPIQVIRMGMTPSGLVVFIHLCASDDLNGFTPVHFCFYMVRMIKYEYCAVKSDLKKFLNHLKEIFWRLSIHRHAF